MARGFEEDKNTIDKGNNRGYSIIINGNESTKRRNAAFNSSNKNGVRYSRNFGRCDDRYDEKYGIIS